MTFDLQAYLIERELYAPDTDVKQAILEDDALLAELAGIWLGHKTALQKLLQARIQPIREKMVLRAHPAEVMVLRQAIVELGALFSDLEGYAAEHERRSKAKEGTQPEAPEEPSSAV